MPDDKPQKFLRAFDIRPASSSGNSPQDGDGDSWAGTLSTAGGLVFFGDDAGELAAADAVTGKSSGASRSPKSLHTSPMTYMFDNKQYVAMIDGSVVYAFAAD